MFLGRRPLLLLLNGAIHTMNPDQPHATALALDRGSGRIIAVGDDADIRALAGPLTDTLDLRGRVVLPGFTDAHTHLAMYAQARMQVNLRDARSEDEAVARVAQRAAATPAGAWVLGNGWDANDWPGGFPTRASLDAAIPDHPVALWNHSYHALWVNSEALRRAGVSAETPDPLEGQIGRGANDEPNGLLFENSATALVEAIIAPPDDETMLAELHAVLSELHARGLTGVHNIEDAYSLRLFQRLHSAGDLSLRLLLYIPRDALPDAVRLGLASGFGDDYLRFAGVKLFMDGALGPRTAAMFDPYEGQPANRGLLTLGEEETIRTVSQAAEGNVGVAIHAIGDRAVHTALNAIEATQRQRAIQSERQISGSAPSAPRYRLEHVQLARQDDIARMARMGVVASVQPFHAVVDRDAAEQHWGARASHSYAYQTLRSTGIPLALGSDVPVDTCDPLRVIHAAVMRRDDQTPDRAPWHPEQALTLTQALSAYTHGAAYAGGQEARQGSLAPGKLADLVVLAEDPFRVPAERLAGADIAATLVGGALVHGALE